MTEYKATKLYQYLSTFVACIAAVSVGLILGWSPPVVPLITNTNSTAPVKVTPLQMKWITSFVPLGAVFGALMAGILADTFGRRTILMITSMPTLSCWLSILLLPDVITLYTVRFVSGIIVGILSTIAPVYIAEIAEPSTRGRLVVMFQASVSCGMALEFAIGFMKSYTVLTLAGIICSIALQTGALLIPESPSYLIRQNDLAKVERVLMKLRTSDYDIAAEINQLTREAVAATVTSDNRQKSSLRNMVENKGVVKSMLIASVLMMVQQLAGIKAIELYMRNIFATGIPSALPALYSLVIEIIGIFVTCVSGLLVDRIGRKILLIVSGSGSFVSLLVLGFNFCSRDAGKIPPDVMTVLSVGFYVIFFSVGWAPIPWLITAELFPLEYKCACASIVVAVNYVAYFVVTRFFKDIAKNLGACINFWTFAAVCLIGVIFVIFCVPETSRKSFQEIQDELAGKTASL